MYPQELPFVLGAEVCGTVEAVGDGVTAPRLGDGVTTADTVGAYAEYCVAPADIGTSVPDGVTSDIAAAAILKGMTAHSSDQVGVSGGAGRYGASARGGGGVNLVLTQWATSLGAESSPLPPPRHKAALSRRAGAWRCSTIPMTHSSSAPRSASSPAAKVWPRSTTAWASRRSTPALPAFRSWAPRCCSARPADRYPRSTPQCRPTPPARCF